MLFPVKCCQSVDFACSFCYFCLTNEMKMEKHRFIIVFGGILILTILVVFLSCHYFSQIKNEQILKATYLFSHAVDLEKELMQPEFISFPKSYTGISSDFTVIEGRFYKFNLSLANSQNLIKATANVILLSQI